MNIHEGKGVYSCPIEIIKGFTDKGQFLYLTGLKGPEKGLTCLQHDFFHQDKYQCFIRKYLNPSWDHFIAPCKEVINHLIKISLWSVWKCPQAVVPFLLSKNLGL